MRGSCIRTANKHLVKPERAYKNKDDSTKELFPHRRFFWACGSCDTMKRNMGNTVDGCCGFKIRFLLRDKKDNDEATHLEVREFKLPPPTRSDTGTAGSSSNTITHEKQLTPNRLNFLHNCGKNRARADFVENM